MGRPPVAPTGSVSFDSQAFDFDRRAGLPEVACEAVAAALAELWPDGTWLLEMGAGTGAIGGFLTHAAAAAGAGRHGSGFGRQGSGFGRHRSGRYVGIDLSMGMLGRFRTRDSHALLALADANAPWPLASGSAGLVFLSRAAHLLAPEHFLNELFRVTHPGGALLVLGRVRRDPNSLRARLRRRLHELLEERGLPRREGRGAEANLLAACVERGARLEPARAVATWQVAEHTADSLDSWRSKPGLAGVILPAVQQAAILDELEAWADLTWGDPTAEHNTTETYELHLARLSRSKPLLQKDSA